MEKEREDRDPFSSRTSIEMDLSNIEERDESSWRESGERKAKRPE